MAFLIQNFSRCQEANNAGIGSLAAGGNALFSYQNTADLVAAIGGLDYFVDAIFQLEVDDLILIRGSDSILLFEVTAITKAGGVLSISTGLVAL